MFLTGLIDFISDFVCALIPTRTTYTKSFCLHRHTPFFIRYRGPTQTHVIVSVYSTQPLPSTRTVYLEKLGWRVGLLGEKVGRLLGSNWSRQGLVEVTPSNECQWSQHGAAPAAAGGGGGERQDALVLCQQEGLGKSQCQRLAKQVHQQMKNNTTTTTTTATVTPSYEYRETWVIRIPPIADDGYYTIRLALLSSKSPVASTSSFRIYSSSLSTPSPRGASFPLFLPLELILGSICTAIRGFLLAALPFAKILSLLPGRWGQRQLVNWLWSNMIGQEWIQDIKQDSRVQRLWRTVDRADRSLPWSKMGVRRSHHLSESDTQRRGIVIHF